MNIPFLKKPTVKFYSESTAITQEYPIYPARDYNREMMGGKMKNRPEYS